MMLDDPAAKPMSLIIAPVPSSAVPTAASSIVAICFQCSPLSLLFQTAPQGVMPTLPYPMCRWLPATASSVGASFGSKMTRSIGAVIVTVLTGGIPSRFKVQCTPPSVLLYGPPSVPIQIVLESVG